MSQIHYNSTDPEHIKERQNVLPPTVEEIKNFCLNVGFLFSLSPELKGILQRLLNHHQNLQHFHDVVGGWEGLNRLKGHDNIQCDNCKGYDLTNDSMLTCNPPIKHYVCNCCGSQQIEKK